MASGISRSVDQSPPPITLPARAVATATPLHVGRRTSVWVTRVESAEGKLASVTTQTQMAI